MTGPRLRTQLTVAGVAVSAVLVADSSGLLGERAAIALDDAAQLAGGLFASVWCGLGARRTRGVRRNWRRLMAIGMLGWSIGQLVWSYYQVFKRTPLPSPSWADVGYLTMPVFALAALLAIAANGIAAQRRQLPAAGSGVRSRVVLVLDGLVIVGSMLVFTWATALGTVVHAGAPTDLDFAVAIAYPITDLMLVVIVLLLLATRPVQVWMRTELILLGLGLVGLSSSDSIFAYLIASGAEEMPPIANAGFIAGPVLVGLAALHTGPPRADGGAVRGAVAAWFHLLMPYLCMLLSSVLLLTQGLSGRPPGNRALFRSRLAAAVEQHRRDGRPLALLFVDLDDFKMVNDSLGHAAGDRVLQAVAHRLRSCVRTHDTVARLGGDEFGVLLEGDIDHPDRVGQRILAAMRQPFDVDGRGVTIGASLGAAVPNVDDPGLSADALLRRADAAMYAGKRRGKGLLVLYGPENVDGYDNPDLPTLLAAALAGAPNRTGLDVAYQPIVRMADGGLVAVEALARWTHPRIGRVPPTVFVAVAERAGLVGALDDFVLDRACREVASNLARRAGPATVHVNVSASRLGHPALEFVVRDVLDRYGLGADHLVLEVTESSRIPDPVAAAASANRLRAMGVRLALDDFGTGYNTLAQLHLLPVDILKLDRTLTAVNQSPLRAAALCASVVRIAGDLGITVVAEGVETAEQAHALARIGCGFGQGHLYGRPGALPESTNSQLVTG